MVFMKETKELTLEDLVSIIATALVKDMLKENGIDEERTLSYGKKGRSTRNKRNS